MTDAELLEVVMGVLAKDRHSLPCLIADAQDIINRVQDEQRERCVRAICGLCASSTAYGPATWDADTRSWIHRWTEDGFSRKNFITGFLRCEAELIRVPPK